MGGGEGTDSTRRIPQLVKGVDRCDFKRPPHNITTDVTTIDAVKLVAKVVFCEAFQSSRRKYRGTGIFKTVSKPLAHLNFLSGVNCYDIGSIIFYKVSIKDEIGVGWVTYDERGPGTRGGGVVIH
jgi:hypothetical protein